MLIRKLITFNSRTNHSRDVVHKLTKNEINQNNSDFNDIQFDFWTEQIRWNI